MALDKDADMLRELQLIQALRAPRDSIAAPTPRPTSGPWAKRGSAALMPRHLEAVPATTTPAVTCCTKATPPATPSPDAPPSETQVHPVRMLSCADETARLFDMARHQRFDLGPVAAAQRIEDLPMGH